MQPSDSGARRWGHLSSRARTMPCLSRHSTTGWSSILMPTGFFSVTSSDRATDHQISCCFVIVMLFLFRLTVTCDNLHVTSPRGSQSVVYIAKCSEYMNEHDS